MTLTTTEDVTAAPPRQVYMVLSPRSLSYARYALDSLFRNSAERLDVHLVTDSAADKVQLEDAVRELAPGAQHAWRVTAEDDLGDAEATVFAGLPNLRAFRHGHPCWRKITDPLLMAAPGEELVLLDPDLYFPNLFSFAPTPATGLLLMWQRPNCLLPASVVRTAMTAGIRLARHVDIGVSHWRSQRDLEWLDWLIGRLGGEALPRQMHVEAIVWSAIAMRECGGYLDPNEWVCWHRTQGKRLRRKLGVSGRSILASEPWATMKCFHGGGEAKWWLPEFLAANPLTAHADTQHNPVHPFVELTPQIYEREQGAKDLLRNLGYYRVFGAQAR